jgi:hypothetical protein
MLAYLALALIYVKRGKGELFAGGFLLMVCSKHFF